MRNSVFWMRTRSLASATTAVAALALVAPPADACGGFFSMARMESARRPSLAYEQTLIVFDGARRREHFVREVVFNRAHEPFGFVVPTPSRPEVADVKESPFASLRTHFPFQPIKGGGLRAGAAGGGHGRLGGGMQVLEVKKVGSFTAFVLAANDVTALAAWLKKNGLASTPQTDAWLAHYVKLGFYYVAMRYDPPAGQKEGADSPPRTEAETMRISFDTPLPYYPYFEPEPAPNAPPRDARLLDVWLVASKAFVPVAARRQDNQVTWVRPLATGYAYDGDHREELGDALGEDKKILPAASTLVVQRFMDQKRSRSGFGDIVFVPEKKQPLDAAERARLAPFLSTLDPRLLEGAP